MSDTHAPAEAGGAPAQGGGGGGGNGSKGAANASEHKLNDTVNRALHESVKQLRITKSVYDQYVSGDATPLSRPMSNHTLDIEDYFVGPRDLSGHSKLPYFLRMHGSVLPRMIVPIALIGAWATLITCIHVLEVRDLGVSTILLTVLGFVVGLALSFRSSTAYERYSEGRKTFCTLLVSCRNLSRYFWVHVSERPESSLDDLLQKVTAMNLILSLAIAVKHRLRFEPYAHYDDIKHLVAHLDTYAKAAHVPSNLIKPKISKMKAFGQKLGLPFAMSNPRKEMKRSDRPLGNLPLELLTYLSSYVEDVSANGQMKSTVIQGQALNALASLTDSCGNLERVLTTPLPVGYNILISQIVLIYIYLLPFQLVDALQWVAIPGTIAAAYIILGIATIGDELENPFGNDVNDLPLDSYCAELQREIDTLMSTPVVGFGEMVRAGTRENMPLWPLSENPYKTWVGRSEEEIRSALRTKVVVARGVGSRAGTTAAAPVDTQGHV